MHRCAMYNKVVFKYKKFATLTHGIAACGMLPLGSNLNGCK
jgi:hypothetical protein